MASQSWAWAEGKHVSLIQEIRSLSLSLSLTHTHFLSLILHYSLDSGTAGFPPSSRITSWDPRKGTQPLSLNLSTWQIWLIQIQLPRMGEWDRVCVRHINTQYTVLGGSSISWTMRGGKKDKCHPVKSSHFTMRKSSPYNWKWVFHGHPYTDRHSWGWKQWQFTPSALSLWTKLPQACSSALLLLALGPMPKLSAVKLPRWG
jgi:hypothetical protein